MIANTTTGLMLGYNWTIVFESAEGDLPLLSYSAKVSPTPPPCYHPSLLHPSVITPSTYHHLPRIIIIF